MEIILLERVHKLGHLGDRVNVKAGYARNYLAPQGKAVRATKENIERFEQRRAEYEKAAADALAAAEKRAAAFKELTLDLVRRTVGEEGKLYGSVGVQEITDALVERGLEVAKREIDMPAGTIRSIGEYEIVVSFHSEVSVTVPVTVTAEA